MKVWAVYVDGEFHSARASWSEAKVVSYGFSGKIEIKEANLIVV